MSRPHVATVADYGADESDEHLSVIWGILRHPVACTRCGKPTRTPSYWAGGEPSPPVCGPCFRASMGY